MRAVAYTRVSTDEQGGDGLGMEWQETVVRGECDRKSWTLTHTYSDVASGKSLRRRTGMGAALRALAAHDADVLVVAKLDRLSRSVSDFAAILARSHDEGWALNVCDLGVDTTTPSGKMVAQIMMVLAEWEREVIGERTKNALAVARSRGTRLGRPSNVASETRTVIRVMRDAGHSWRSIADALDREGVATAQGGRWHAATVRKLYLTA